MGRRGNEDSFSYYTVLYGLPVKIAKDLQNVTKVVIFRQFWSV